MERPGVANDIGAVMARRGIPQAGYRVQVTEPIHFMSTTVRTEHRGSPVFTLSGDNATLRGILWGRSSGGNHFVFSPFSAVQDELGSMNATTDGGGGDDDDGPNCPPNSNNPRCR